MKPILYACLVILLGVAAADAAIEYVDVDLSGAGPSSNTVLSSDASPLSPANLGGWAPRGLGAAGYGAADTSNFANNGNALQDSGTSAAELKTTISGLDSSESYNIYAFFWDDEPGNSWDIAAGLASGSLTDYDNSSADVREINAVGQVNGLNVLGQAGDDNGYDDFVDGNRILYAAKLNPGAPVTGVSSVDVFVKSTGLSGERTWYDGVGYQVIPEPASAALGCLAFLGLAWARRRR